jgi:glucan biosynthesis protein C
MSTSTSQRLHALDAVRGGALMLGIVLHAAISFMPGMVFWPTTDNQTSEVFNLVFYIPHMFRMTLFFFIAGFFARMSFHKKGSFSFAKDRFKRVVLPMAVFWAPLFAAIVAAYIWGAIKANGGEVPEDDGTPPSFGLRTFPLAHLWFLYLLVFFYAASFAIKAAASLIDRNQSIRRLIDGLIRFLLATPFGLLLIAAPLIVSFWTHPMWIGWFGIPTPDYGFIPNNTALIAYGSAFVLGWLIQRQTDLLMALKNQWWIYLALAAGLTGLCLKLAGVAIAFQPAQQTMEGFIYAASYALGAWCWSFGLIGAAMSFWSKASPIRRYLADASYWLYLMHLPLVMALQILVSDLDWPITIKFAVVLGGTMFILLASYHWMVRPTVLGGWLNGRRHHQKNSSKDGVVSNTPSLQP